jgi:hypothetical protein
VNPNDDSGALSPDSEVLGEQLDTTDIHRLLAWYFAKETTTRRSSAHDAA